VLRRTDFEEVCKLHSDAALKPFFEERIGASRLIQSLQKSPIFLGDVYMSQEKSPILGRHALALL